MIVRVGALNSDDLPELVLECLLAFSFHLPFGKGFFVTIRIIVEIILADGVDKPSLHALLSKEFAHIIKISLIAAICSACLNMTVAYKKMDVLMRFIGMNSEQHFISLKMFICKLLCDAENFIIGKFIVIIGRKRYGHLESKISLAVGTFSEQASCHEDITGVVITVAIDAPIKVGCSLYYSVPYLFRQSA